MILYVDVYKPNIFGDNLNNRVLVARFVCSSNKFIDYVKDNPGMVYELFEVPVSKHSFIKYL